MHEAEEGVVEYSQAGRSTADGGTGPTRSGIDSAAPGPLANPRVTHPSGRLRGVPDGEPTRPQPQDDYETIRGIELENSGAEKLADQGWRVKQNPTPEEVAHARQESGDTGNPVKNPDYLIEGRVFDAASPVKPTKSVRNIWSYVEEKVVEYEQTQRVVINLEDWRGDLSALRKQFADWPMENLKEVMAITPGGEVVQIDLPDQ